MEINDPNDEIISESKINSESETPKIYLKLNYFLTLVMPLLPQRGLGSH